MNKYDKKGREEVGFSDMGNYDFGGLEIEEKLQNGYLLYVPYGIHKDIFDAIEQGLIAMGQRNDELMDSINKTAEIETIPDDVKEMLIKNFNGAIEQRKKHIKILETILPISYEV